MRITLLNLFFKHGGAETIARHLLVELLNSGHQAKLLVGRLNVDPGDLAPHVAKLSRFYPEFVLQRLLSRLGGFTDAFMLLPLRNARKHPDLVDADIVHMHTLNGSYLNLRALPILARRTPLVLTLHDMWAMTGDCDHSEGCRRWEESCGSCPMMKRPFRRRNSVGLLDHTRWNLHFKRKVFARIPSDRLVVTAPSRWLADQAAASHLGRFPIEVVPNGIDLTAFKVIDQNIARDELGLPRDALLFAAVAANWSSPHKGGDLLIPLAEAVNARGARLVVAGQLPPGWNDLLKRHKALLLEGVQSSDRLSRLFCACDASFMLSRNENYPTIVMESIACGCPVVARAVGGIPEMIELDETGAVLPSSASAEMMAAAGFALYSGTGACRETMRERCRNEANDHFSRQTMLERFMCIYRRLSESGLPRSESRKVA